MNLPNKLTMLRVCLIPVFMIFVGCRLFFAAAVVFSAACFTDYLDGAIARKRGLVTDFGKLMDPLADKILTTTALIYLVASGLCSPVVLVIIIAREFAVSGVRLVAAESGRVLAANIFGKIKTAMQMVVLILTYLCLGADSRGWAPAAGILRFCSAMMWVLAAVTLLSGIIYLWDNRECFSDAK